MVRILVQVRAALPAQAGAILTAGELGGKRQREGVARPPAQRELLALGHVLRGQLLSPAGLRHLAGLDLELRPRRLEAAHARALEGGGEAQAQRPAAAGGAGDVQSRRHQRRGDRVRLAAVVKVADRDMQVEPAALAGAEAERRELEGVGALRHLTPQIRTLATPVSAPCRSRYAAARPRTRPRAAPCSRPGAT